MDVLLLTEFGANRDLVARSEAARKNGCRLINLINDLETLNDIENNQIRGLVCDGTFSKIIKTKIPPVIYNRTNVKSTTKSSLIEKLVEKSIFLNSLDITSISGSKINTYNFLEEHIKQPETKVLENNETFLDYIDKKKFVFLKPNIGLGGNGIVAIRKEENNKYIVNNGEQTLFNKKSLDNLLSDLKEKEKYLYQSGIDCPQIEGGVFDIRVIYQRSSNSELLNVGNYARISSRGKIISNISQKGSMESIAFVERYFKEELLQKAVNLSRKVIKKLESKFQFGELGLDIMFDRNFNPYLIEINSKPGFEGPQTLAFYAQESKYGTFSFKYSDNDRKEWGEVVNNLFTNPFLYAKELVRN